VLPFFPEIHDFPPTQPTWRPNPTVASEIWGEGGGIAGKLCP
jgi:hypothetical protein